MRLFLKIFLIFLLASVLPVFTLGFFVISGIKSEVEQIYWFLGFLAAVVFAGVLVAKKVSHPVVGILRSVKEVSKGNLGTKLEIHSSDELGQLAHSFNELSFKLKEQRDREIFMARMKTEFISITAHQLRTPLSSIKWTLKMVLDGDLGAITLKQKNFLEKSYSANQRMIELVNDLLDISRIEEGRFGFEFGKYDVVEIVESLVDLHKPDAVRKKIELNCGAGMTSRLGQPFLAVVDPARIRMAISNLIDNAIRYTNSGGKVDVVAEKKDNFILISVKDNGVGIPEKQKHRIFEKFFRADNVVKKQVEGTGLGLYLVKNIVEKHGGKIWFESEENKGTIFYLTLPLGI